MGGGAVTTVEHVKQQGDRHARGPLIVAPRPVVLGELADLRVSRAGGHGYICEAGRLAFGTPSRQAGDTNANTPRNTVITTPGSGKFLKDGCAHGM